MGYVDTSMKLPSFVRALGSLKGTTFSRLGS